MHGVWNESPLASVEIEENVKSDRVRSRIGRILCGFRKPVGVSHRHNSFVNAKSKVQNNSKESLETDVHYGMYLDTFTIEL